MDSLAVTAFMRLRQQFWNEEGLPVPFHMRDKRNTQDDPLDEHIANIVFQHLPGVSCAKSSGPLITPDLVLYRPDDVSRLGLEQLASDNPSVLAIEVKKLERTIGGNVARSSGLDYNTTPPCGRVRVYDKTNKAIDVRCFYLFVCLERADDSTVATALSLVDGDILNADFEFYLSIVGERSKQIHLGTYKDGADRARPMLIFSNPLGIRELDHKFTLVHKDPELADTHDSLVPIYTIVRSTDNGPAHFFCYGFSRDVPAGRNITTLVDPFVVPLRKTRTQPRGRFHLPFAVDGSE